MKHVTSDSGLLDVLLEQGHDFFTGVPDSALKQFIGELHRMPAEQHVPAAWEAEAVGIAAGAYLAGRRWPYARAISLTPTTSSPMSAEAAL